MKIIARVVLTLLFTFSFSASLVSAHSPFIVPTSFAPLHQGWVSLDAGFAETFFQSEVAFDKGNFQVLTPAGEWHAPARLEQFTTRTLVEYQTQQEGTYRFTTGMRKAAIFRFYELNGERKHTRDPQEVLPKGAKLLDHYQSVTLAETYISLKKPTNAALKPYHQGLEIIPLNHPNDIYAAESFAVKVLLDGKPLRDIDVSLFTGYDLSEQEKATHIAKTDRNGAVEFTAANPGVYLLHVRHTAPAPKGAEAPNYGYVYTLTFAVNPAL